MRAGFEGEGQQCCHIEKQVEEGSHNHYEEGSIVVSPHAVIDPHTVMIEILHASITGFAMPGLVLHVALAIIAVEQLILVTTSNLFKPASPKKYSIEVLLR